MGYLDSGKRFLFYPFCSNKEVVIIQVSTAILKSERAFNNSEVLGELTYSCYSNKLKNWKLEHLQKFAMIYTGDCRFVPDVGIYFA